MMLGILLSLSTIRLTSGKPTTMKCYACTTIDAEEFLNDVQDQRWKNWLENIRFVPQMKQCADKFDSENALRYRVKRQACDDGLCMKMAYTANNGEAHIWRSCIFDARHENVQSECTQITSSRGKLDVCICGKHLCNGTARKRIRICNLFLMQAITLYLLNKHF